MPTLSLEKINPRKLVLMNLFFLSTLHIVMWGTSEGTYIFELFNARLSVTFSTGAVSGDIYCAVYITEGFQYSATAQDPSYSSHTTVYDCYAA